MTPQAVHRAAWKGAVSNYSRVVLRLVLGLLTFRLLYQGLTAESFGLWSLLWSVFGYGVLFDFGFGAAAQKRVAESLSKQDWHSLSQALSTILAVYSGVALVIAIGGYTLAETLLRSVGIAESSLPHYLAPTRLFFCGMAVAFPLGIFAEVLRGLQQTHVANRLAMGGLIANAALIATGMGLGWSLLTLFLIALSCVLLPDVLAGILALRRLPNVHLHPRHCRRAELVETSRFSLFVWASTLSHLLRSKTDQLVIGLLLSLPAVALYQAAGKVAEMMAAVTKQIAEALTPAAAYLHADGRSQELRHLFLQGLRATVAVATPLYLLAALHLDLLLWILTGQAQPGPLVWATGQLLLFWCYQQTLTHLVFRRLFVMCGKERPLMWQSLTETTFNLILSVALTLWWKNILGVAVGSVIPAVVLGWAVLWPWALKETGLHGWTLFHRTLRRPLVAGLVTLIASLTFSHFVISSQDTFSLLHRVASVILTSGVILVTSWRFVLTPEERTRLHRRFRKNPPSSPLPTQPNPIA